MNVLENNTYQDWNQEVNVPKACIGCNHLGTLRQNHHVNTMGAREALEAALVGVSVEELIQIVVDCGMDPDEARRELEDNEERLPEILLAVADQYAEDRDDGAELARNMIAACKGLLTLSSDDDDITVRVCRSSVIKELANPDGGPEEVMVERYGPLE